MAKSELGDDFPRFAFGSAAQWVDLDSEGIPGVLVQQSRSHRYKRNLGSGKLSGGRTLPTGPAISEGPHQMVDVAGSGTIAMVTLQGTQPGFQERMGDGWGPFVPFRSFPRVNFDDPNTRLMDINGDGFEDIVVTRGDHIEWYPSLGREGYGPARKVPLPTDQEQGPRIVFADPLATVMVADMNGDGIADLVRVTESGVTYWPNLGYGRFGAAVQMDNAPFLENKARFDARRVRLADLDGTGTADLLYFTADGLRVFRNQSGNSFVEEGTFMIPPEAINGSILDLFGTGTSCVFWSPRTNAEYPYGRYWDPLLGKKPHLLTDIDNHCGRLVHFNYAPSTKHYLADRKAGRQWPTKLPFPVYVVESVESYDAVSRTRLTSSYKYSHGHYDTHEREFRGFGYVEQLDAERFGAEHGQGSFPSYPPPINGEVPQNPILTKTWFHTGAWRERADQKAAYEKDYWKGDTDASVNGVHLECTLPTGLTAQELREGWRALRGTMIRQEVFELDNTATAAIPYTVTETNYDVRKLQAPQKARGAEFADLSAVFHTVERETRTWAYERIATDPRVSQTLALDVDAFGIVTRSAAVAYKRRGSPPQPEQNVFRCVVTEQDVLHFDNVAAGHRLGVPIESRAFELTDSSKPAAFLSLETVQTNFTNASLIPYEQTAGSGIQKRLIQREKARYYDSTA
ncbi:MAG: VCBS repeat-containing protein, partial [Myxococcales bacterium]|nr:VCBS repeat-containing protein [Myxococcales bacterium]